MVKLGEVMTKIDELAREIQKVNLWQWVRFHSGESQYSPDTVMMKVNKARPTGSIKMNYPRKVTRK